jgi:hypothetical protein
LCSASIFASHASFHHAKSFLCAGERPVPRRASLPRTSARLFFAGPPPPRLRP